MTGARAVCTDCGWTSGLLRSPALASYAVRRHSCAKRRREAATHARGLARDAAVDRTPRPCLHQRAHHVHGTYTAYTLDRCRCVPCAAATSAYNGALRRRNAYGRSNLVDAGPVRAHIAALHQAGIGLKRLIALGAASGGELTKLVYGVPRGDGTHRPPARRVRAETAQRILSVTSEVAAAGALVDATGTTRRLRTLVAQGWSVARLSAATGLDRQPLDRLITGAHTRTTGHTRDTVAAQYSHLITQGPPTSTWHERQAASRSRNRAATAGWTPPPPRPVVDTDRRPRWMRALERDLAASASRRDVA